MKANEHQNMKRKHQQTGLDHVGIVLQKVLPFLFVTIQNKGNNILVGKVIFILYYFFRENEKENEILDPHLTQGKLIV